MCAVALVSPSEAPAAGIRRDFGGGYTSQRGFGRRTATVAARPHAARRPSVDTVVPDLRRRIEAMQEARQARLRWAVGVAVLTEQAMLFSPDVMRFGATLAQGFAGLF